MLSERSFLRLILSLTKRPWLSVAIWTVLLAAGFEAVKLIKIDADIANLLPKSNPHVQAMEKLQATLGGESAFDIAVKGKDFKTVLAFSEEYARRCREMKSLDGTTPLVTKTGLRNDVNVIEDNFLYFLTQKEMDGIEEYLGELILDAKQKANPFYVEFDDEEDSTEVEAPQSVSQLRSRLDLPPEYRVNSDSTVLLLQLFPSGSKSDFAFVEHMAAGLEKLSAEMMTRPEYAGMEIFYGSGLKGNLEKVKDLEQKLATTITISSLCIIGFLFLYMGFLKTGIIFTGKHKISRFFLPILVLALPPIASITFTYAIALMLFGSTNIMTTALIAILFGINVDYTLHLYSDYIHYYRQHGHTSAVLNAFSHTGKSLFWSCLTTAFALLALMISDFRGFYEFGLLAAIGILSNFVTTFALSIPVLTIFNKRAVIIVESDGYTKTRSDRFPLQSLKLYSRVVFGLAVLGIVSAPFIEFEYSFSSLERSTYVPSAFNVATGGIEGAKSDPTYFLVDSPEEAADILDRIESQADGKFTAIHYVESLTARVPANEEKTKEKLARIAKIRQLLNDPFVENQESENLDKLRKAVQQTEAIPFEKLPDFLRNRFMTKDNKPANLVVVFPTESLSDGRRSIRFKRDSGIATTSDGKVYYAASTPILGASILEIMQEEALLLILLPLLASFLTMYFDFRSIRWAMVSFLPLASGVSLLIGFMVLTGQKFNIYNIIVLPIILGVGDDTGIHFAHRLKNGFDGNFRALFSTIGIYVTASSATTFLGFIGLMFIDHPGLESMGHVAAAGVTFTLLSAFAAVPVMYWLSKKDTKDVL